VSESSNLRRNPAMSDHHRWIPADQIPPKLAGIWPFVLDSDHLRQNPTLLPYSGLHHRSPATVAGI